MCRVALRARVCGAVAGAGKKRVESNFECRLGRNVAAFGAGVSRHEENLVVEGCAACLNLTHVDELVVRKVLRGLGAEREDRNIQGIVLTTLTRLEFGYGLGPVETHG